MPQFRKHFSIFIKTVITFGLLAFLIYKIHWRELLVTIQEVRPGYLLLSSIMVLIGEGIIAIRLKVLLDPTIFYLPVLRLLKIGFVAWFYAFFLPAGLGLGIARWFLITGNKQGRFEFALVTLVEKSLFFGVCLLSIVIPLMILADAQTVALRGLLIPVFVVSAICLTLLYAFALWPRANSLAGKWIMAAKEQMGNRMHFLGEILPKSGLYLCRFDLIGKAGFLTLLVQAAILARIITLFYSVGVSLPMITALWISSLVFVIQALPISLAGIGVRESAFAYAFGLYGLSPESGVAVGVLFFGQMVLCALIGGSVRLARNG